MHEHPIIFSAPMVRAILEDRKTNTRRVAKLNIAGRLGRLSNQWHPEDPGAVVLCPYGQPGDRLWVREACRAEELTAEAAIAADYLSGDDVPLEGLDGVRYLADNHFKPIQNAPEAADAWGALNAYRGKKGATVPSIHMPRWASRITLEITDVRVQRVREISATDAWAEGIPHSPDVNPMHEFEELWDSINGARGFGWNTDPWVWAITFKRVTP